MIQHVHIPKTGGSALAQAYATSGAINRNGHAFTLSWLKHGDDAITIVRDPVDRFVSAFNWIATYRRETSPVAWPWASPDAMALGIGSEMVDGALEGLQVFIPQSHWLDGDLARLIWVGRTETLRADYAELKARLGIHEDLPPPGPTANTGPPHQPLSERAIASVRDWYADDYELLRTNGWLSL